MSQDTLKLSGSFASHTCFLKYEVSRNEMRELLTSSFHISLEYQHALSHYQLLYWSPEYLQEQIQEGTLSHLGTTYIVIWDDSRFSCLGGTQCKLSFRQAQPEYELPAYVLVRKGS